MKAYQIKHKIEQWKKELREAEIFRDTIRENIKVKHNELIMKQFDSFMEFTKAEQEVLTNNSQLQNTLKKIITLTEKISLYQDIYSRKLTTFGY